MALKAVPPKRPTAPEHLSADVQRWWAEVVAEWSLDEHHRRLLTLAGEAWDRCQQARAIVDTEGLVVTDRFAQVRPHPMLAVERDCRASFGRLLRELDLDAEPPTAIPTRRGSRYTR